MGVVNGYGAEAEFVADRLGGLEQNPDPSKRGFADQYDAFRHAYTSAMIARYGVDFSKWLGDLNEGAYDPQGRHKNMTLQEYNADKNMDLWNNNVGRQEYLKWKQATEAGTTTV